MLEGPQVQLAEVDEVVARLGRAIDKIADELTREGVRFG